MNLIRTAARGLKPHRLLLTGFWQVECHKPVEVSDPEKFHALLGGKKIVGPAEGRLWLKQVRQLIAEGRLTKEIEALFSGGGLRWADANFNRVVNTGLDNILDVGLASQTRYVGLADGTPTTAAGDTMASHAGWTEITAYSETVRQTYTDAGVSSQSCTNSASKAQFSINGTTTTGGAFLTTDNAKSGTAGTLVSVEAFTEGDRSVVSGDTVSVTITYTIADS